MTVAPDLFRLICKAQADYARCIDEGPRPFAPAAAFYVMAAHGIWSFSIVPQPSSNRRYGQA